jgi:hypothetical protein
MRITDVLAVPAPPTRSVDNYPFSFLFSDLMAGRPAIFLMMNSALVESIVGIRS